MQSVQTALANAPLGAVAPPSLHTLPSDILSNIIGRATDQGEDFLAVSRLASVSKGLRAACQAHTGPKLATVKILTKHLNDTLARAQVPEQFEQDMQRYLSNLRFNTLHFPHRVLREAVNDSIDTGLALFDLHTSIRGEAQCSPQEKALPSFTLISQIMPFTPEEIMPLVSQARGYLDSFTQVKRVCANARATYFYDDFARMSDQILSQSIIDRKNSTLSAIRELPLPQRTVQYGGMAVSKAFHYAIPNQIKNPLVGAVLGALLGAALSAALPSNDQSPVILAMPLMLTFGGIAALAISSRSDPYASIHY